MSKSIKISPKHGVNPSMLQCACCGKDMGIALFGRLKGDAEAPKVNRVYKASMGTPYL